MLTSEFIRQKTFYFLENKVNNYLWTDENNWIIKKLSIDDIWQVWEEMIYESLKNIFNVEYDANITNKDKWYDIIINWVKIEIKTATISNTWVFQHENLEIDRDFDAIIFLDITPDKIFLTMSWKKDIVWNNLTQRKNWVYKCDIHLNKIYNWWITRFDNYHCYEINDFNDIQNAFYNFLS